MTDTDEKISFDPSKEEQVPATENKPQRPTESFQNENVSQKQEDLPAKKSDPAPRKTLMGMGFQLPMPEFAERSDTPEESPATSDAPQLPKPLRLPALRQKLALKTPSGISSPGKLPTPERLLEPISQVGYDDSFEVESSNDDEVLADIPEVQIEEFLDDIPEVQIEENLDDIPEVRIEEALVFISDITPLDSDEAEEIQESLPSIEVLRENEEDFDDEATQIGAGLYDFPEKQAAPTPDAFDDEHTQISEGLSFEHDRLSKDLVPELASSDVMPADPQHAQVVAAASVSASLPVAHDDDFVDEKTELYDSPFENDPISPKLTVLSGPALGMEFFVNKMRNSIGRGTNNTIMVPDASMSRQHFEINQSLDESFVIRDLQAVNGTFLNGTRIVEADLFHGDRIEAGKTVIQFLIGSTAPQVSKNRRLIAASLPGQDHLHAGGPHATFSAVPISASASSRDPGRLATYVALICAVLCIPLIALVIFVTPSEKGPAAADIPAITNGQTASQTYLAGVEAVKKREWLRARALFLQTTELEPNFDGIPAQLTRIDHELAAAKLFEDAQADIEQKNNEGALAKVRSISQNSVYFDDAQRLVRQLRQQEVFSIFDDARVNFEKGELNRASELLTELLEIVPSHDGGIELKARIEGIQKEELRRQEAAARAALAAAQKPSNTGVNTIDWASSANDKSAQAGRTNPNDGARAGAPVINFTEGFTHYRTRNFDKAIQHFESIASSTSGSVGERAERTVSNIRRFETSFNNGQAAFQKSSWAEAARHFQEANRADVAVGGASGYFSKEISEKLARSFAEMGMDAIRTKQYQRAYTSLKRGRSHFNKDERLDQLSDELIKHATTLYDQANQLKSSDPKQAAANCRTVLAIVNANTPVYQNAKKLLDTL